MSINAFRRTLASGSSILSTRTVLFFVVALSLLAASLGGVTAGGPQFWRIDTFAEVSKGEASGVSIAGNGEVTLAPAVTEVFDTGQATIWSAIADRAGNVYLGTGSEGRVYRVDPAGKGALLCQTPELGVMALAVDAQGALYAGTSPDGKVYRITSGGEVKPFFDPKSKYIWSLAFDPQGRLLVGTGEKGTIFRVTPDGVGVPLATVPQSGVTALRVESDGTILAGTDPGGLVLRIDPAGRVFTLFDSPLREIRDLTVAPDGAILALALAESAGGSGGNAAPPPSPSGPGLQSGGDGSVTVTLSDVQVIDSPAGSPSSGSGGGSSAGGSEAKSAIYRIAPNGAWQSIWESREAVAFATLLLDSDRLLAGTGQQGRIYAIATPRGDRPPALHARIPESQTSRLVRAGNRIYAAASNLGKLYLVAAEPAAEGSLTSTVHDARNHSTWGRLAWVGEGPVEIRTRSGNTSAPDATWSDWSTPLTDGAPVASPAARYLQWRATLRRPASGSAPRLREVTVSYLPTNLAPRLYGLSLLPVGVSFQPAPAPPLDGVADYLRNEAASIASIPAMPPRRAFQRGAISLQWQADDPNGDNLQYSVLFRGLDSAAFHPLRSGITETFHTIDASELPDGRYIIRVVASDRPSNPDSLALTHQLDTEPVTVDNTPPLLSASPPALAGLKADLSFRAADATSVIRRAEYQLDGGPWLTVFPADGLADSREETFRFTLTLPDARPHTVALRVLDANLNIGTIKVPLEAK